MFGLFEMISQLFSLEWSTILTCLGSAAIFLPLFGMSVGKGDEDTGEHDEHCDCGCHGGADVEALEKRIVELEGVSERTLEENEELADLYVDLAAVAFEDGDELKGIVDLFDKSEAILKETLKMGEDAEIRRRLGNVYLHRAVAMNDYDELDAAIESYGLSIEAFKPLEDQGDGEAKYDIAGVKLNRGTIYHEIGEYEKARIDFDDSFTAFRAVEKISDLDTRYYMAKVSIAQGSLLRDMDEPLDKIVDAYNRAMRLFVELIDIGQMEHERDLANALMDRCTATYEVYKDQSFESETDRTNKIADVLVDVGRGIEILERLAESGNYENRTDLFNALTTQGAMLLDLEKFTEAKDVFDRAIEDFSDFDEDTDPVLLSQYAAAHENRGFCLMNLDRLEEALADFNESIRISELIQGEHCDLEDEEKAVFLPSLATYYANRANAYASLENKDAALADSQYGLDLIRSLKEDFGDELDEIEQLFESLIEQWK